MSLLPFTYGTDLHGHRRYPHWAEAEDLHDWPLMLPTRTTNHLRDLRKQLAQFDNDTSIIVDKNHFQATIDVQQFKPDEISVRLIDDHTVKVEARHEEQQDDHGFIQRHFVRRYLLPKECDATKLQTKLSSDGVLVISAPKRREDDDAEGLEIPIVHTRRPLIRRPHLWPSHHSVSLEED